MTFTRKVHGQLGLGNIYYTGLILGGGGGGPIQDTLSTELNKRTCALSNPVHTVKRTMPLSIMIFIIIMNIVTRVYRTNDYVITVAYSNF